MKEMIKELKERFKNIEIVETENGIEIRCEDTETMDKVNNYIFNKLKER